MVKQKSTNKSLINPKRFWLGTWHCSDVGKKEYFRFINFSTQTKRHLSISLFYTHTLFHTHAYTLLSLSYTQILTHAIYLSTSLSLFISHYVSLSLSLSHTRNLSFSFLETFSRVQIKVNEDVNWN